MSDAGRRILVTGGSGFIGTNLVERLLKDGCSVLSLDHSPPQNPAHQSIFRRVDLLDREALADLIRGFDPRDIVHLAARTDLVENQGPDAYAVNTVGVRNLIAAASSAPGLARILFASTKLVLPTDRAPSSDTDFAPGTAYGSSKAEGERIVREEAPRHGWSWCILRPTSIWGPWCSSSYAPYGTFFRYVERGLYFHLGHASPPKTFGFVGNTVLQIGRLLELPREAIDGKVFYLGDYPSYTIREWADAVSLRLRGRRARTIPLGAARALARTGDLLKALGWAHPPLTSFRLANMLADTGCVPLDPIRDACGPLPFSLEDGIDQTIRWMREAGLLGAGTARKRAG